MMGFTFLKDYSGPFVEMDRRVQEGKQVNYCRGPDKKSWLGLIRMEKNVLTEKYSRGNINKIDYWLRCGG